MSPENYRLGFWILFVLHLVRTRVYIGPDAKKYDAATFCILTR